MTDKAYPYPQIVTGDSWDVFETVDNDKARTDNLNRKMYVPMDRSCKFCGANHSKMIRRKQLGYTKWSPKTLGKLPEGVREEAVLALDSARINYLLGKNDKAIDEPLICEELLPVYFNKMMIELPLNVLLLDMIGTYAVKNAEGYSRRKPVDEYAYKRELIHAMLQSNQISPIRKAELEFISSYAHNILNRLTTHRYGHNPSYRKVQKLAVELSEVLDMFTEPPEPWDPNAKPEGSGQGDDEENNDTTEETTEQSDEISNLESRMRTKLLDEMKYKSGSGVGKWGTMQIWEPPLPVNLAGRLNAGRNYRAQDYGYVPKYINRWCIDKKIFKQKQRVLGGTILIDASGSMMFDGKDILEIMSSLPGVTIAMYNGYGWTGDLRIIAKNGRRVDEKYLDTYSGGGNVVDGPALEWLATQSPRRIWVSDMKVFGAYGDTAGFNLLKQCYDLCTKHKIINLEDIEEVKKYSLKLNEVL